MLSAHSGHCYFVLPKSEQYSPKKITPTKWRPKTKQSSESHQNGTEMISGMRWSFYLFCQKVQNLIIQSQLPWTKKIDSRTAPNSAPVHPQTQNSVYYAPVDPQAPNSLYSVLGEQEHKTRARVKQKCVIKKHMRYLHRAPGNSQDTTNTFLDR